MRSGASRHGYSLLELITVIGITGVCVSLALPGLGYVKERRGGEYDAEYLAGKLRQLRAETLQAEISVRLDIVPVTGSAGVYRLKAYKTPGNIGRGVCHSYVFTQQLYDIEWDLKSGYYVYADTDNGLCYYPGGSSSGGSVLLTDAPADYVLTAGEQQAAGTEETPPLPYLGAEDYPGDYTLHAVSSSVKARVDVPIATGIPDVLKTFVAYAGASTAQ